MYELLVGKGAANMRRDPLQRVRDDGMPMGGLKGGVMRHAIVALSTHQPFAPCACLPTTNSYTPGTSPFLGNMQQVMYQHLQVLPKPPSSINSRIPPAVDDVILRALAKKPEDRLS